MIVGAVPKIVNHDDRVRPRIQYGGQDAGDVKPAVDEDEVWARCLDESRERPAPLPWRRRIIGPMLFAAFVAGGAEFTRRPNIGKDDFETPLPFRGGHGCGFTKLRDPSLIGFDGRWKCEASGKDANSAGISRSIGERKARRDDINMSPELSRIIRFKTDGRPSIWAAIMTDAAGMRVAVSSLRFPSSFLVTAASVREASGGGSFAG